MSRYTIAFNGSVAAGGETTLVSKRINFPFQLENFHCSFALGQDRTVRLRLFHSFDDVSPSSGVPTGTDLLNILGQSAFVVGDDETKIFPMEVVHRKAGSYLKVHALNIDGFTHTIDVLAVVNSMSLADIDSIPEVIAVG